MDAGGKGRPFLAGRCNAWRSKAGGGKRAVGSGRWEAGDGKIEERVGRDPVEPRAADRPGRGRDGGAVHDAAGVQLPCAAGRVDRVVVDRQQRLFERHHRLAAAGAALGQLAVAGGGGGLVHQSPTANRRLAVGGDQLRAADSAGDFAVSAQDRPHHRAGDAVERGIGGGGRGIVAGTLVRATLGPVHVRRHDGVGDPGREPSAVPRRLGAAGGARAGDRRPGSGSGRGVRRQPGRCPERSRPPVRYGLSPIPWPGRCRPGGGFSGGRSPARRRWLWP